MDFGMINFEVFPFHYLIGLSVIRFIISDWKIIGSEILLLKVLSRGFNDCWWSCSYRCLYVFCDRKISLMCYIDCCDWIFSCIQFFRPLYSVVHMDHLLIPSSMKELLILLLVLVAFTQYISILCYNYIF
jgi:hypothetical protein